MIGINKFYCKVCAYKLISSMRQSSYDYTNHVYAQVRYTVGPLHAITHLISCQDKSTDNHPWQL
jgi:hypothetical protein